MNNSLDYIFGNVKEDIDSIYTSLKDQMDDTLLANYPHLSIEQVNEMDESQKRMLLGWD